MAIVVRTLQTDSDGNAYFPLNDYNLLFAVATNTVNTTLTLSRNQYDMYYVNIKKGDNTPCVGQFQIWGLVSY